MPDEDIARFWIADIQTPLRVVAYRVLERRTDTRIFQDLTVVESVKAVVGPYHIPVAEQLEGRYPKIEYCVQS